MRKKQPKVKSPPPQILTTEDFQFGGKSKLKPPSSIKYARQLAMLKVLHRAGFPTWRSTSTRNKLLLTCTVLAFRLCPRDPYHAFKYAQYAVNRILRGHLARDWDTWKAQPCNRDLSTWEPREDAELFRNPGWDLEEWKKELGFSKDVPNLKPRDEKYPKK